LGFGKERSQRGCPLLAEGDVAERIIERVARISKALGTAVEYRSGIGAVRP